MAVTNSWVAEARTCKKIACKIGTKVALSQMQEPRLNQMCREHTGQYMHGTLKIYRLRELATAVNVHTCKQPHSFRVSHLQLQCSHQLKEFFHVDCTTGECKVLNVGFQICRLKIRTSKLTHHRLIRANMSANDAKPLVHIKLGEELAVCDGGLFTNFPPHHVHSIGDSSA